MCEVADFTGNKTLVCTVDDLQVGQRYRDPEGNEYLIAEGDLIVNVATGAVTCRLDWVEAEGRYRKDTKLGTDRAGRLYASRSLNQATKANSDPGALPSDFWTPDHRTFQEGEEVVTESGKLAKVTDVCNGVITLDNGSMYDSVGSKRLGKKI